MCLVTGVILCRFVTRSVNSVNNNTATLCYTIRCRDLETPRNRKEKDKLEKKAWNIVDRVSYIVNPLVVPLLDTGLF